MSLQHLPEVLAATARSRVLAPARAMNNTLNALALAALLLCSLSGCTWQGANPNTVCWAGGCWQRATQAQPPLGSPAAPQAPPSSMLTQGQTAGCPEWSQLRFTCDEASQWQAVGVTDPRDADNWRQLGVTDSWRDAIVGNCTKDGVKSTQALDLARHGLDLQRIERACIFLHSGYTMEQSIYYAEQWDPIIVGGPQVNLGGVRLLKARARIGPLTLAAYTVGWPHSNT